MHIDFDAILCCCMSLASATISLSANISCINFKENAFKINLIIPSTVYYKSLSL